MRKKPSVRYEGETAFLTILGPNAEPVEVMVDASDVHLVFASPYRWEVDIRKNRKCAYVRTRQKVEGKSKWIMLHRLVMQATEGYLIDHINRNTLDNRKQNLRRVSPKENARNRCGTPGRSGLSNIRFDSKWNIYTIYFSFDSVDDAKKAVEILREMRGY